MTTQDNVAVKEITLEEAKDIRNIFSIKEHNMRETGFIACVNIDLKLFLERVMTDEPFSYIRDRVDHFLSSMYFLDMIEEPATVMTFKEDGYIEFSMGVDENESIVRVKLR